MKAFLAVVLSSIAFLVSAQSFPGYVIDGSGQIVQTGTGLCLHSGYWVPANGVLGCDPVIVRLVPVTLDSDVLFEFDSAVLTPAGRTALDILAPRVGGQVIVQGHTDRIGTDQYNKKLSFARANAVAQYLGSRAAANYVMIGLGSSKPSGKTDQCTGPVNQALIQCLAPDRRVVITVVR